MKRSLSYTIMSLGSLLMTVGVTMFLFPAAQTAHSEPNQQDFTDFACLSCHTNQNELIGLAQVEETEEEASLSSGPG